MENVQTHEIKREKIEIQKNSLYIQQTIHPHKLFRFTI